VAQTSVGLIETYFVGKVGTNVLAGIALPEGLGPGTPPNAWSRADITYPQLLTRLTKAHIRLNNRIRTFVKQ